MVIFATAMGACLVSEFGCSSSHPDSKLELINRIDHALRAGSVKAFSQLLFDPNEVDTLCKELGPKERSALKQRLTKNRDRSLKAFTHCGGMVDWSKTERVALNYGYRSFGPVEKGCDGDWQGMENSELYYRLGDRGFKVDLRKPYQRGSHFGILRGFSCYKKPPEAQPTLFDRLPSPCRLGHWPWVTQTGGTLTCDG